MTVRLIRRAAKDFETLPEALQKLVKRQLELLRENLRHPSLNAKKYPEAGEGIWQGRVNLNYRFYFVLEDDAYVVLRIIPHPK